MRRSQPSPRHSMTHSLMTDRRRFLQLTGAGLLGLWGGRALARPKGSGAARARGGSRHRRLGGGPSADRRRP